MTRQIAAFSTLVAVAGGAIGWQAWSSSRPMGFDGRVDLRMLGDFDLPPDADDGAIPQAFRDLDGRTVSMEGFASAPDSSSDRLASFQFVYTWRGDSHRPPRVQERVFATVAAGHTVADPGMYTMVQIHGVLHVGVNRSIDGGIDSVYRMDVDHVTDVK